MATEQLVITVRTFIEEVEADCSHCYCCGDVMVGKMYNFMLQFNNDPMSTESTECNICQSCHQLLEK